ncbi:Acyl-CoA synthetase (AMP-forming)/AMP-acid ligase II [Streptoalloteichus tenebrarius]|uniref:Acyl-CoA synthetase (AMP-forming)/AMP-acid ligase II n=2 Tax=Streptoalloteichus tenebrarius (strain ATCC 17920 / DSM 40477 / JCM 4838 / CBS 697.72 / NBRC 16177 / NCIMB 11028 / NRRL B-12390 / A12253. 1 / ISP 5477) TaxID=1933 RepID=A0ABT1HU68_STRSD|nr:Acyl-CoA synthetase (AMP-forming)/AMP-acid ligase II [Streptoalloteichus tenebrarius]
MMSRLIGVRSGRSGRQVERDALRVAAALRSLGVAAGDRVLFSSDNHEEYLTVVLAAAHLDTSLFLVDHRRTVAEKQRLAERARVRWTISDSQADVEAGIGGTILPLDALAPADCPRPLADGLSWDAWRRRPDAMLLSSSGSTGEPKIIAKSGRAFLDNLERTRKLMGYTEGDVLLPILPFSHQYGLSIAVLAWISGASLVVGPYRRLDQVAEVAGSAEATITDATPATYRSLLNLLDYRPALRECFRAVRMWCTGGAPLDRALARRFRAELGAPVLDGYGSSEAGNVAFATPDNPVACGRLLDGVRVAIRDERGEDVLPGQVGELWLDTPDLMSGYLDDAGELTPTAPGEYPTHDLGYWDPEGNLHVLGRKFAVHRLGHTLYPEAIERRAEECGRPVRIVALDDERRGSSLVFVVEDAEGSPAQRWRREFSAILPSFEQPNHVVVVPRFPLNGNGKPDAHRLRELVLRELATSARRAPSVPSPRFGSPEQPVRRPEPAGRAEPDSQET